MIKVIKINWLSKEAREAEILLSDGIFNIVAFSHPFHESEGNNILSPLYALNARKIYNLKGEGKYSVVNIASFEYKIVGHVINKELNQIEVGEFFIQLDTPLPGDINKGDYLSFECDRLDLY